jgi:transposase
MDRARYIGLDAHARTCDLGCVTASGKKSGHWHVPTSIPDLVRVLEEVPRPRKLVLEEGPMADWLARELRPHLEELVICDPRRNALIGKGGEKTDAIDAFALADLYRGNYLRAVHHPESLEREVFKRHVAFYHDRVGQRVREANKTLAFLRRLGIVVLDRDLADRTRRKTVLERVPADEVVRLDVRLLLHGYDQAARQVLLARRALVRLAKAHEPIRRFVTVPGIKWVRAASLFVYLDTPERFPSKSKLWKYMGIGLEKITSGGGPVLLRTPRACNRHLKDAILGAALTAARLRDNPFAVQYRRLTHEQGMNPRTARRTVARSIAAVVWGMWKSGGAYDPARVGVPDGQKGRGERAV